MDIKLFKKNESTLTVHCNSTISSELYNFFSCMSTNFRFDPRYKQGVWDGKLHFFNRKTNELSIGLYNKVFEFARKGNYQIESTFKNNNTITREQFQKFIDYLELPFPLRPYQFDAAYEACCKKIINIHISTAGGKSLVIYIICRFMAYQNKRVLLIAPQTQLTEQMRGDFDDYGWNVDKHCRTIYGGQVKNFSTTVSIATWQTVLNEIVKTDEGKLMISEFDCIIVDEAHTAAGKSIQAIAKYAINASYRFGFSGTYPAEGCAEWFSIVGAFGPIKTFADYKHLQEHGYIAPIKIFSLLLSYPKTDKVSLYNTCNNDYQKQNDFIYGNKERNKFISKLVQKMDGNCLLLFTKKEKHGYIVKDLLENELEGKQIIYLDGDTAVEDREDVRKIIENNNNIVLIASYGILSAGWNVKNLHNIVFLSGYKSKVKVLQSIGRGLRQHKDKDYLKLYDLVDDFSFEDKKNSIRFINHSVRHAREREQLYAQQGWTFKTVKIKI